MSTLLVNVAVIATENSTISAWVNEETQEPITFLATTWFDENNQLRSQNANLNEAIELVYEYADLAGYDDVLFWQL